MSNRDHRANFAAVLAGSCKFNKSAIPELLGQQRHSKFTDMEALFQKIGHVPALDSCNFTMSILGL